MKGFWRLQHQFSNLERLTDPSAQTLRPVSPSAIGRPNPAATIFKLYLVKTRTDHFCALKSCASTRAASRQKSKIISRRICLHRTFPPIIYSVIMSIPLFLSVKMMISVAPNNLLLGHGPMYLDTVLHTC